MSLMNFSDFYHKQDEYGIVITTSKEHYADFRSASLFSQFFNKTYRMKIPCSDLTLPRRFYATGFICSGSKKKCVDVTAEIAVNVLTLEIKRLRGQIFENFDDYECVLKASTDIDDVKVYKLGSAWYDRNGHKVNLKS